MSFQLKQALNHPFWKQHKIGDYYTLVHRGGYLDSGWRVAYFPLFGTYDNKGEWINFLRPRVLIEKPIVNGIDFREVELQYLIKTS